MLDRLQPRPGARKKPIRVGRGHGSGKGKTCGRGVKGQGKRSAGRETPLFFEGGQMPMTRRLPKRGFHHEKTPVEVVNVAALAAFSDGETVDREALASKGIIRGAAPVVKLLGEGEAPKNLTVRLQRASAGARKKIEDAGGTVEIVA
jgi:large subunit ribosomal protein L15